MEEAADALYNLARGADPPPPPPRENHGWPDPDGTDYAADGEDHTEITHSETNSWTVS